MTNGTVAGTTELTAAGAAGINFLPLDFTVFGNRVLFSGVGAQGRELWVTDGTSAGTSELTQTQPKG